MKRNNRLLKLGITAFVLLIPALIIAGVVITSPSNGQRLPHCENITIKADASVDGGEIKSVQFIKDGYMLKSLRSAPFEFEWESVPMGIYTLTAKMTDKENTIVYSDPVQIFVGDVVDGDLVKNGEFNCADIAPWSLGLSEGAQATLTIDNEGILADDAPMAIIDIENPGTENWHVMLIQPCPLLAGHIYEIYFLAEVDRDKTIAVDFQNNGDDWAVHFWQDVVLTPGQIEYGPVLFECGVDDPGCELKLALSSNAESIFMDQIRVIDTNWEPVQTGVKGKAIAASPDFVLHQNYPNPFNPATEIGYYLNHASEVDLSIYNIQGQWINTLVKSVKQAGNHTVQWYGLDASGNQVPSGSYIYKLKTDKSEISRQMLLLK